MKNIIDFYECGLNAGTPANTLGMGNPCAPTDTTVGSEPLIPTCKKGKCKKEKTKKSEKIEEASLLDIEGSMTEGDEIINVLLEYAKHLADFAKQHENVSYTEEEILDLTMTAINNKILSRGKSGEIIFDYNGFNNIKDRKTLIYVKELFYNYGTIIINTKKFPKDVKKLTLKNFKRECIIDLYGDNDISNLDITVEDNATLTIRVKESNNIVKLGKIICNEISMSDCFDKKIKPIGISFKTGSLIKNIDLSRCTHIETIVGNNLGVDYFSLNANIISHNLIKSGLANQKTQIDLEYEKY